MSTVRVTALRWAPPFAQGVVRDFRVRWALEEAGIPYEERLVGQAERQTPAYRAQQPFGQVPVYEEGDLVLFESGAIVQHVAQKSPALWPADANGRARATAWMFSALNSVEPAIWNVVEVDLFAANAPWAPARRPHVEDFLRRRLGQLSTALGARDWLEDRFTAGDLLMSSVLRILRSREDLLAETPNLVAYRKRCEARPAFERAIAAQMKVFAENAPPVG